MTAISDKYSSRNFYEWNKFFRSESICKFLQRSQSDETLNWLVELIELITSLVIS